MKTILRKMVDGVLDFLEIVFRNASENYLRFAKTKAGRVRSYIQLKRQQKHLRRIIFWLFFMALAAGFGMIIGPVFFNPQSQPEIFIPNGRGDIIIGNVSKNEATVVFKTLDAAHGNRPIATKAAVTLYADAEWHIPIKTTAPHDYAVTHAVPLDGLDEGRRYYLRILASEAEDLKNPVTVSVWGSGDEPLMFEAVGDLAPSCPAVQTGGSQSSNPVNRVMVSADFEPYGESVYINVPDDELAVIGVQHENYLHGRDKVQTIISWLTTQPATSVLKYREGKEGETREMTAREEASLKHSITLTTLKPGTTYYFAISAQDESGVTAISDEYSLRTPQPKDTVLDMVGKNFKAMVRQIGL